MTIVGGGTAGHAGANRLLQLLADDPALMESLGEVPVAHARYLAGVNAHAELDIVAGAGHGFMHTFRPEVMLRLRAFLDRNTRAA